jgi:hypothetical protein
MFARLMKRLDQQSRLFGEMLRRFTSGTRRDMTMGDAQELTRAITRCRSCGATERCEAWLESSEGTQGADEFCPNAETFRQLGNREKS